MVFSLLPYKWASLATPFWMEMEIHFRPKRQKTLFGKKVNGNGGALTELLFL